MTVPFDISNDRIFYACQAVFVKERNSLSETIDPTDSTYLTGVQSVGTSSDIPSRALPDIGRYERNRVLYSKPSHEITIERVLDKNSNTFYYVSPGQYSSNPHILHANNLGCQGFPDNNQKSLRNYDITILYSPDRFSYMGAGNDDLSNTDLDKDDVISITYTNCLIRSIDYNIGVDGVRESITLSTRNLRYNYAYTSILAYQFPAIFPESGDILKRNDFDFLSISPAPVSILPLEIDELFDTGQTDGTTKKLGIQSIDISVSIDYSELEDIGNWRGSENLKEYEQNKYYYVNLPISVSCSFTGILKQSLPLYNFLNVNNGNRFRNVDNIFSASLGDRLSTNWMTQDKQIKIAAKKNISNQTKTFLWDLGTKNYITNIGYSGGDTDGGNAEATISYQNSNSDIIATTITV